MRFIFMMKAIAVAVVVALVMFTVVNTLKTTMYRRLVGYLEKADYDHFYEEIDRKSTKFLFPKSAILDLKLNAAIIQEKKKETTAILDQLCSMPLTNSQKENYYMKAFNFYAGYEDEKNCRKYLKLINELPNDRIRYEANRVFNIFILKNDKDLSELLEELDGMEDRERGVNEYLISVIYKNRNDTANQKKYEELSKEHFALVDEETAKKLKEKEKR